MKLNTNNQNILSEESSTSKTRMKLDLEINSSIFSSKQQNSKNIFNNKENIFSPLSMSITTQNSFFKNKKTIEKNNKAKSMKYYRNNKSGNLFIIKNNLSSFFNHKKNLYNNRILLRDILLQEKDYFNLKYEENKIFLSIEQCNEYIKEQMLELKKNKIKIQHPEKFEKIFQNSKFGHPILILNPIVIEFKNKYSFDNTNIKKSNINNIQVFNIPFEYIPLFYFDNFEKLKEILISIFYLDENYNKFYTKYENLSYILRNSDEFKENEENKDYKNNVYKKEFTFKLPISHSQTLNRNPNSFKNTKRTSKVKKDSLKSIDIYNTEYNFNSLPERMKKFNYDKNILNKKNIFEFIWLCSSYQYLVTLKTPEICFKINDIEIKKNIDIELLFFLAKNNFKN